MRLFHRDDLPRWDASKMQNSASRDKRYCFTGTKCLRRKGTTDAMGIGEVTVNLKAERAMPKGGKRGNRVSVLPQPFVRRRPIGIAPEFAPD
jgi:hypothetical protein